MLSNPVMIPAYFSKKRNSGRVGKKAQIGANQGGEMSWTHRFGLPAFLLYEYFASKLDFGNIGNLPLLKTLIQE